MKEGLWQTFDLQEGECVSFRVRRVVASHQTAVQQVDILDLETFGLALFIDHKPQSSDADEFIFNESLTHPGLCVMEGPKRAFVAGYGAGAAIREILKHNCIEQIIACDIDRELVDLCAIHLGHWAPAVRSDPRFELVFNDARAELESRADRFDFILVDLNDPLVDSSSQSVFRREFFQLASQRLTPGGVLVSQAGRINVNNLSYHRSVVSTAKAAFERVQVYAAHIPFYAENWGFALCGQQSIAAMSVGTIDARLLERRVGTRFYDGVVHHGMFAVPRYIRDLRPDVAYVASDSKPLRVQ